VGGGGVRRDLKSRFTHLGEPALYNTLSGESKREYFRLDTDY